MVVREMYARLVTDAGALDSPLSSCSHVTSHVSSVLYKIGYF